MSLPPRHSQFDDPEQAHADHEASAALALQLAAAAQHGHPRGPPPPQLHGGYRGPHPPPHHPPPGGHYPPPPRGVPPGAHHPGGPHHGHGGLPPHLLGAHAQHTQHAPPGSAAAGGPAAAFLHPSFNQGLVDAIAAQQYMNQRQASAAAHVAAAQQQQQQHAAAAGVQPFLPGGFNPYAAAHHAAGLAGGGHPPPQQFGGRGMVPPPQQARGTPQPPPGGVPGMVGVSSGGHLGAAAAFMSRNSTGSQHQHPGMSPALLQRPGSTLSAASAVAHHHARGTASASPASASRSTSSTPNPVVSTPAASAAQKNTSGSHSHTIHPRIPVFSNGRPELPHTQWYDASIPLGVTDDKYYLSELQCVLRSEFVEAFGTTQTDIVMPQHGRNRPIALGQVGIRCQHCLEISGIPPSSSPSNHPNNVSSEHRINRINSQNAVSYPNYISGIYSTVQQMYRLHFDACQYIPDELKKRVANLKDSHTSNRGGRKQYWIDSAKRIGIVDTSWGMQFGRDPEEPLPPMGGNSTPGGVARRNSADASARDSPGDDDSAEYEGGEWGRSASQGSGSASYDGTADGSGMGGPAIPVDDIEIYPLVLPEDRPLISDYLYLALEQMQPCNLMDADRVGCYKGRRTGFPGLACRHCIGQAGCGRYFPASEASLSQTTTSQTIVNHVRNCRRCPLQTREQLELMKRAKTCPDYKKTDKPKHGGRKVFFHRLWCRIQRIPLPANEKATSGASASAPMDDVVSGDISPDNEASSPPLKSIGSKEEDETSDPSPEKKKRRKSADMTEKESRKSAKRSSDKKRKHSGGDLESDGEEEVVETVEFDNVHHTHVGGTASSSPMREKSATPIPANENAHMFYQGRTRLIRGDDPHWLSESDCFVRQELAEVFTAKEEDLELDMYGDPEHGQVGIRCFYCAESKPPEDRSKSHVYFPNNINQVQQAVSDLTRRHLGICSEIPDDVRKSFQSMKGYGSKPKGDTAQYWADAAKELGLHDSTEGQGIIFFRNPLNNSPADDGDIEKASDAPTGSVLVPLEDRSKCTDHMLLLLKQFEPCQFRSSDRKSSRSRDRAIGFPGLVCVHCKQKRYFPITEKKLQDSLSLMTTHINNCFHAPLDVKASLCYLQHRSLLQKQELSGQWKFTFFKGVWNRLHTSNIATESSGNAATGTGGAMDVDASVTTDTASGPGIDPAKDLDVAEETKEAPVEEEEIEEDTEYVPDQPAEEEVTETQAPPETENHGILHSSVNIGVSEEPQNHADALKGMKGLVRAAALWLSERDSEYEARAPGGGRGRAIKRR